MFVDFVFTILFLYCGIVGFKFFMFQYLLSITSLRIYVMVTLILILIMVIWSSGDDVGDVVGGLKGVVMGCFEV